MTAAKTWLAALFTLLSVIGSSPGQSEKGLRTLQQGKPIERVIAGGQVHEYRIELAAGQYLYAVVEQRGIDVVVTLFGPDGKKLIEVDSPNGTQGPEPLYFIAALSGAYRVNVRSLEKDAPAGRYQARIEELRTATDADRDRIAGQAAFAEAQQLREKRTAESFKSAVEKFDTAAKHFRASNQPAMEAEALNLAGLVLSSLGGMQKALEYFNQALLLLRTAGNRGGEAAVLYNMGEACLDSGENQKALDYYNQALTLWRAVGDKQGEAAALNNIGVVYSNAGENRKALEYYTQVLPLRRASGNKGGEATALGNIGHLYADLGENQKALEYYGQALPLLRAIGDRGREGTLLNNFGAVYSSLGQKEKALDYYNQALSLARAVGDRRGEALALNNVGRVYNDLGENQKALEYHNQALPLHRALSDRGGESAALHNIGKVYRDLGEPQKALEYYNQALLLRKAVSNRRSEAETLNNMGMVYKDLGEPQKALEYYSQALPLERAVGNREGEASTLNNMGMVYKDLGEYQKALEYCSQALPHQRAVGDRGGEAATLNNIGLTYAILGEKQKALQYLNDVLPLVRSVGDRRGEGTTLNNIAAIYSNAGENLKALDYHNQALPLLRAAGDRRGEATTLSNIGAVYRDLGERQKALAYYNEALPIRTAVGDRRGEAATLLGLARIERDQGNLTEARTHLETALKILEWLRSNVTSPELRASYFASVQSYHRNYVDLLMEFHRTRPAEGFNALALEAGERGRARSLLEMLWEGHMDIRQGVEPALLERERGLTQRLNGQSEQLVRMMSGKPNEAEVGTLKKEISKTETELQQIEAAIRKSSPRYAALTQPEPQKLKQIQQQLLDSNTVLLEYCLLKERSFLWVVGPNSLDSFELPKQEEIESAARQVYELLTASNRRVKDETEERRRARIAGAEAQFAEAAKKLSKMTLGSAAKLIEGKRLLMVADGALQYIPFGALPDPGSKSSAYLPLVAAHEVVSVPSASVLAEMRRETAGRKAAVGAVAVFADPVFDRDDPRLATAQKESAGIGSLTNLGLERSAREVGLTTEEFRLPRLPFTRQEAEQISGLAGKGPVMKALDLKASVTTATSQAVSGYRIVHFATHGLLNAEHPGLSGLVLSLVDDKGQPQNGFLKLQDVYNLNLPAELVVLSACQTGLGKEIRGEGLIGLTRGFMYAGTKRVVASLWKVDDVATAELMKRFYQGMLVEKKRPAEALRQAQVAMWKQRRWSSPYYWAAFVLQGEWN